jgi:hypothetical protein
LISRQVLEVRPRWAMIVGMLGTRTTNEAKDRWKMPDRAARKRTFATSPRRPPVTQPFVTDATWINSGSDPSLRITTKKSSLQPFYIRDLSSSGTTGFGKVSI